MEHREHGAMAYRAIACLPAVTGQWRHRGGGLVRSTGPLFGQLLDDRVLERPDLAPGPRRTIDMGRLGAALTDPGLDPPITALVVYDCNPAVIVPNQAKVLEGLARDDLFTVVLEQFVNDTARYADVVLPATTQIEHLDLVAPWGHLYLTLNQPAIEPVGEALPNTEVFRRLAAAMGYDDDAFGDSDEDMIRQVLAAADHPFMDGITFEALRDEGSQRLRVPDDWRPFAEGAFPTASRKVELRSERLAAAGLDPLPTWTPAREGPHGDAELRARYPLTCMTLKRQLRFLNSSYGHLPAHRRAEGEPLLEIAAADASSRGIDDGAQVRVWNDRGALVLRATISDRVRAGLVAVPFGWALDAAEGGGCNVLTNDASTDLGRSAAFHDNLVEVTLAAESDAPRA
jgi:anaerobic selenocysteine-containing dehydrogenase